MKTLQFIPAYGNMEEIQKITTLICECVNPLFVILFGHYAGMYLHSPKDGYEFLILTDDASDESMSKIYYYLNENYPVTDRKEKHLSMNLLPLGFVNSELNHNYFLSKISTQGLLLYDSGKNTLWKRNNFNCISARKEVEHISSTYLSLANQFLTDAKQHYSLKEYRSTAFNLYQAARLYLWIAVKVYYGYVPKSHNYIYSTYSLARHISGGLYELWDIADIGGKHALNCLNNFKNESRFKKEFNMTTEILTSFILKIQKLAEETTKICEFRMDLLGRINGKEYGEMRYIQQSP